MGGAGRGEEGDGRGRGGWGGCPAELRARLEAADPSGPDSQGALEPQAPGPPDARVVGPLVGPPLQVVRFQYRTILVPGRAERSFAEHTAIVEAVAAGDPDAAEAAMRRHLSAATDALRESVPYIREP